MKVLIAWSELTHFQKTVEMTEEEFAAWDKRLDENPRSKLRLFDEQKLALAQADDWDEIEIDRFEAAP